MTLEIILVGAIAAVIGFLYGRKPTDSSRCSNSKETAYMEIFDAYVSADRALMKAWEDDEAGNVSEETKVLTWDALNELSRTFSRVSFLLPSECLDVIDEFRNIGLVSWSERLDQVRDTREKLFQLARKDVGAELQELSK